METRRWYDRNTKTNLAMKLIRELDETSRVAISKDIINIANSIKTIRKEQETLPLSIGVERALGLYQSENSRRWYDQNSELGIALKIVSTLPEEDYINVMQGICESLDS